MTELTIFSPFPLHRGAWKALLANQPGILVTGEGGSPSSLSRAAMRGPATILVDVPSPAPALVHELKNRVPNAGLLILVETYNLVEAISLLRAGATGLISRQETTGDLARAIIAVGRGEIVLPPALATQGLLSLAQGQFANTASSGTPPAESIRYGESAPESLTERETEVLDLLARGLTNKDIAQSMVLSVRTIEAHLRNVFGKLGVRTRTEAVLWAIRNGYGSQNKS